MQVPNFIRQIPVQFDHACRSFIIKGAEAQQWIAQYAKTKIDGIGRSDLWQQYAKDIYERNIEPLTKFDYFLFAGSLATALLVIKLAINRFTIGALPLAAGGSTLIVMGSYYISRYRVRKHFNEIAWEYVDQIRKFAHVTTSKNKEIDDIIQLRAYLRRPEFAHWDSDLKLLDEEIRKFREALLKPHSEDKKEIVKAHLDLLRTHIPNPSADKNLLDELEQAIDKVGQSDQDLKEIETRKQQLVNLQTPAAMTHIDELKKQVNALVKAAERPSFQNSKKAFIKFLEGFQNNLASYRDIEPLLDDESGDENDILIEEDD